MRKVLVLQHVASEGLGIMEKTIKRGGLAADFIKIFMNERIPPRADTYCGVIVLGGPMGVYEEDIYPFIKDELRLIRDCLGNNVPILGICLGAQLLAKAAGAYVYKGKKKEIGWYKVSLTEEGKRDGLFIGLPDEFTVFQWHGDTFNIPEYGTCLASSELFQNQIVRAGRKAYGLQFHLEVTEEMIKEWLAVNGKELVSVKSYINPAEILKDTPAHIDTIHRYGEVVFSRFISLIHK